MHVRQAPLSRPVLWPYAAGLLLLWLGSMEHPFFWDSLQQASRVAHWMYEGRGSGLSLPAELDSGHPPFFGWYLAYIWSLLGKELWVSHLAVLPFIAGIFWQSQLLVRHYLPAHAFHVGLLLLLLDATLLAQMSLVSPDLVLYFAFLWAWYSQVKDRPLAMALAGVLLAMVSIRGLFLLLILWLFACWRKRGLRALVGNSWPFVPALLVAFGYYGWHFGQTGWWLSTPGENWGQQRGLVGPAGVFRNVAVLGWRLLDCGRLLAWLLLAGLLARKLWMRSALDDKSQELLAMGTAYLLVFGPVFLLLSNPIGHRYLLPLFACASLLLVRMLLSFRPNRRSWLPLCVGVILCMLSGNFWIYPRHISQGWDASLAHWPYFELRDQMIRHIDSQGIDLGQVGSEFPNLGPIDWIDLNGRREQFAPKDLKKQQFVFYSNVFNDFSDAELAELEAHWKPLQLYEKRGVCVVLYGKIDN
ncbi:MAG: hypothetical protein AAFV95_26575 [Bacteroidota bacterium]